MKRILMFFVAVTAVLTSCSDNDDLWSAVDDLKSRVQALETQVGALNGNVEALQTLYSGATITEVVKDAATGTYTLTLSDGQVVELKQGSDVTALVPLIGIDDEGFWQVSTDNGATWKSLGVKAVAQDGRTPQFRIDETTGYWQVRYADTEEWTNVLGTNGQPVTAVGSGASTDKFFEKAEPTADGNYFYIKLLNGTELTIPILKDFYCRIVVDKAGVQTFDAGQTRRFVVEMKGVADALVTAPEGWAARLTDNELIVTAPVTVPVTRAMADSSKDVAIQAVSASGLSAIAKIQVETNGQPAEPPTVSVAASTSVAATDGTLTFDVTFSSNTDVWKYQCLKSSEAAPADAATLASNGSVGVGSSVTVSSLDAQTEYTIYVVAIHNSDPVLYSSIASATARTTEKLDLNDYYAVGVEVGGVRYSKDSENVRTFRATADDTAIKPGSGGVYFIDSDEGVTMTAAAVTVVSELVLIGRHADEKTEIDISRYWPMRAPGATVAFKNLVLDWSNLTDNYAIFFSSQSAQTGGVGTLLFEDCEIIYGKQSFITAYNGAANQVGNIIFRNCKIRYMGTETTYLVNLNATGLDETALRSLVFENNIIYTTNGGGKASAVLSAPARDLSNATLTIDRNTFVDILGFGSSKNSSALFTIKQFGKLVCTNNLFYSSLADKWPAVVSVYYDYPSVGWPQYEMDRAENRAYSGGSASSRWKMFSEIASGDVTYKPVDFGTITVPEAQIDGVNTKPLDCDVQSGVFRKNEAFTDFGSSLE